MGKAVKINTYKSMVKPVVVYGSDTWAVTDGYEKIVYMGEENRGKSPNMVHYFMPGGAELCAQECKSSSR